MRKLIAYWQITLLNLSFFAVLGCEGSTFKGNNAAQPDPKPTSAPALAGTPTAAPVTTPEALIEGVKVVRVGINFEDNKDNDFNDAVLCFTGKFVVDTTTKKVQSSEDNQTVKVNLTNRSGCTHRIKVEVVGADGQVVSSKEYPNELGGLTTFDLQFGLGQFLNTTMYTSWPAAIVVPQTDAKCQVLPDVCNVTGS